MVRASVLLVFFVLGLIVTLALTVPVRILWSELDKRVALPVQMHALNGNLWAGEGSLPAGDDYVRLRWRWQPGRLLDGVWGYSLEATADHTELALDAGWQWSGQRRIRAEGMLGLHLFEPLADLPDFRLRGQAMADGVALAWDSDRVRSASGSLLLQNLDMTFRWTDGSVQSRQPDDAILRLRPGPESGSELAILTPAGSDDPLLRAELSQDNRLMLRLYARVRDWAGLDLPGGRRILMESEWPVGGYLP